MLLSLLARQRHVVGHLEHQRRHFGAELPLELFRRRVGVLDRVVERCRLKDRDVSDPAVGGEDRCDRNRMIDVRCLVAAFATLIAVFFGGEGERAKECGERQKVVGLMVS